MIGAPFPVRGSEVVRDIEGIRRSLFSKSSIFSAAIGEAVIMSGRVHNFERDRPFLGVIPEVLWTRPPSRPSRRMIMRITREER